MRHYRNPGRDSVSHVAHAAEIICAPGYSAGAAPPPAVLAVTAQAAFLALTTNEEREAYLRDLGLGYVMVSRRLVQISRKVFREWSAAHLRGLPTPHLWRNEFMRRNDREAVERMGPRGYAELDGLTLIIILGGIAACAFAVLAHVQADDRARARLAETQACACWEAEPITLGTTSDDGAVGLLLSPRAVSAAPSSDSLEVQP